MTLIPGHNYRDLTGLRIDAQKLTVLERAGETPAGHALWRCRKDSGKEVFRTGYYLLNYKPVVERKKRPPCEPKPSKPIQPEYSAWSSMLNRCSENSKHKDYRERGIQVCERWQTFKTFFEDMGPRPSSDHSLDRIDVNGNYEPANCRWATRKEQARNTRTTLWVTYEGRTLSLAEWAETTGIPRHNLVNRLKAGLPLDQVFTKGRLRRRARTNTPHKYHGVSHLPDYGAWKGALSRCTNPQHPAWRNYGGRGITVCEAWYDFHTFQRDIGPHPGTGYSLDRIDVNKGYEPGNCRWATREGQANNRRGNHRLTLEGRTQTLTQWCIERQIPVERVRSRLRLGWSVEEAFGVTPRV